MEDEKYMLLALDLAQKGTGFTSPNPMVGAVVVKDNRIVGKGYHAAAGQPHAEVNAIEDAGLEARGGTLYVTLEPCNHTGRTPPCTEKILAAGIRRVVVAMRDPNPDVKGGGLAFLSGKGIDVTSGVCEDSRGTSKRGLHQVCAHPAAVCHRQVRRDAGRSYCHQNRRCQVGFRGSVA